VQAEVTQPKPSTYVTFSCQRVGCQARDSPEGQLLHDPAPDAALYVPAGHAAHVPPFGPVKPASHAQSEAASLPAGEEDPAITPSRQLAARTASYFKQAILHPCNGRYSLLNHDQTVCVSPRNPDPHQTVCIS